MMNSTALCTVVCCGKAITLIRDAPPWPEYPYIPGAPGYSRCQQACADLSAQAGLQLAWLVAWKVY